MRKKAAAERIERIRRGSDQGPSAHVTGATACDKKRINYWRQVDQSGKYCPSKTII